MKNLLVSILALTGLTMASCSSQYMVEGSTSDSKLEGYTLHFRTFNGNMQHCIDSTTIVHGQFVLNGTVDSATMVSVPLLNDLPLLMVLETGDIRVDIANQIKKVSGSPMNDTLYTFLEHLDVFDEQLNQLACQLSQMEQFSRTASAMMGFSLRQDPMVMRLRRQFEQVYLRREQAVGNFIINNCDNVLGPGVFRIAVSDNIFPLTDDCLRNILSNVDSRFARDPFVESYLRQCNLTIGKQASRQNSQKARRKRKAKVI